MNEIEKEIEEMAKVICQQQYFNTHCVEHCNLKGYCCEVEGSNQEGCPYKWGE